MGCGCSTPKVAGELDSLDKSEKHQIETQSKGINLPLNSLDVFCFTIGDIEDQDKKLEKIISFLKLNPRIPCVFLGDLFDDVSWPSETRANGIRCVQLLDDAGYLSKCKLHSLDDFRQIKFKPEKFNLVENNVKFIVGNSECYLLDDILKNLENNPQPDVNNFYTFGTGEYQKKFTFEQLSLFYRYLMSCYSVLTYEINTSKTLYFRHAANTFRCSYDFIDQCSDIKPTDRTPMICGHNKGYGSLSGNIFMNDTCFDEKDYRICIIEIENDNIVANSLSVDFEFPQLKSFPRPPPKK